MSDENPNRERFTDRVRDALKMAQQEARRMNHEYVGTEHILLGLLKIPVGVGVTVLKKLGVDPNQVILRVENIVQIGADTVDEHRLLETPCGKKTIEYAVVEAQELGYDYVGTEHLMLGLLREDGVGSQILRGFNVTLDTFRTEALRLLNQSR